MRLYRKKSFQDIQFDKAAFEQFLRGQGLKAFQIKELTIRLAGGKVLVDDRVLLGDFVDDGPILKPTPTITIYPEPHIGKHSLNDTLLEETGHFIQWSLGTILFSDASVEYKARPEEIDAKEFASRHKNKLFLKGLS